MPPAARKLRGPQLYSDSDIAALSGAAFLARLVLDELLAQARSGVLPLELASVCLERIELAGAKPVMVDVIGDQGQPFGHACAVSTDDTIAHALPDEQPLRTGQLATIDLMLSLDGWHADVADTVVVGGGGHPLLDALDAVWQAGLKAIAPGVAWSDVAAAMAGAAEAHDVRLVQGLAGHGIGLAPHELPALPLVPKPSDPPVILRPGMVFTLEPAITSGSGGTVDSEDGWAIRTADGSPAVAREAMIVVENEQTRVLGAS
ncbi:MAG: methionyl aminopeptidase [Phycisphaera sp.]|nr:MAG: methionyl aminopeptidase [Phycisphaera sp.]